MNPLDERARHASMSVSHSVAAAAPPVPFAAVVRRAVIAKVVNVAIAGAAAVAFIGLGAAFREPTPQVPVADTRPVTTTVAPTETVAPVRTPREDPPNVVALPTTTSTSAVPTTTVEPTTTTTTTTTLPPDTEPPIIVITFPESRQRFTEKNVTFEGTTEPGATVMAGDYAADVDREGHWQIRLVLSPGRNRATFTATDAAGNTAQASVVVFYDVVDEPPDDTAEFTANAKFGSSEATPPYDVYFGRGEPGSTVTVSSEYGGGVTAVGDGGEWEIKVFFPEAPFGDGFLVSVADDLGRSKNFEFVSYSGGDG